MCIFALQSKLIKDVYVNGSALIGLISANYIKDLYYPILPKIVIIDCIRSYSTKNEYHFKCIIKLFIYATRSHKAIEILKGGFGLYF